MKKDKQNQRIARYSLWIFYGLLAYMPFHIFLSTWIGTSFDILPFMKMAKDMVLVGGFLLVLFASLRMPWFKQILRDRLVWLIIAYAALHVLLAAFKDTDWDAELLGIVYNTRFLLFFLYAMLLSRLFDVKKLQRTAVKVVLVAAVPVLLFGVIQYTVLPTDALTHVGYSRANGVLPAFFIDDKPDLERVMSTLRDPNSFGSYLIIIGMLAAGIFQSNRNKDARRFSGGILILTLLCLWFTFSRSAWLGFVLAAGVLAVLVFRDKVTTRHLKAGGIAAVIMLTAGVTSIYTLRDSYFIQNVVFHADESTTLEDPNELRARFWRESVSEIANEPEGTGPGTAGLASIRNEKQGVELNENYYLQIASEVGVAGIVMFLGILLMVALRLFSVSNDLLALGLLASLAGLMLTNFLVHIWSNEAVAYTWWGLAGIISTYPRPIRKPIIKA